MKPYALIASANTTESHRCQRILLNLGYQVQVVTTGARAQVQLAFTTPDLILLDMDLPDVPGEVVLRQINAQRRLDTTTLILFSLSTEFSPETHRKAPAYTVAHPVNTQQLSALAANPSSAT